MWVAQEKEFSFPTRHAHLIIIDFIADVQMLQTAFASAASRVPFRHQIRKLVGFECEVVRFTVDRKFLFLYRVRTCRIHAKTTFNCLQMLYVPRYEIDSG